MEDHKLGEYDHGLEGADLKVKQRIKQIFSGCHCLVIDESTCLHVRRERHVVRRLSLTMKDIRDKNATTKASGGSSCMRNRLQLGESVQ